MYVQNWGKFFVCGILAHLRLAFFEDVNIPNNKAALKLSFRKTENGDDIDKTKTAPTDATSLLECGGITINEFIRRVLLLPFKTTTKTLCFN